MPENIVLDQYSAASFQVKLIAITGEGLGNATAFFYEHQEDTYLITNWHALSGRHPHNGKIKGGGRYTPVAIEFRFHIKDQVGRFTRDSIRFELYDENRAPLWIQHPSGQKIDVAAIKITVPERDLPLTTYPINKMSSTPEMKIQIGGDVFVLGFPFKDPLMGILPVWKRGTIASEYDLPVNRDLPCFLIDSATREGMSGSPVILRSYGSYDTEDGGFIIGGGYYTRFLGVYSGRYGGDDLEKIQIGIVWKKEVIEEIISNQSPGDFVETD